jgi:hypothetical protein
LIWICHFVQFDLQQTDDEFFDLILFVSIDNLISNSNCIFLCLCWKPDLDLPFWQFDLQEDEAPFCPYSFCFNWQFDLR